MNIQHSEKDHKGIFCVAEHGESIAEMVYKIEDETTIVIVHTEVIEAFEGRGVGQSLIKEAVNYARKNSIKIKATCQYAKSVLEETMEYKDVYIH